MGREETREEGFRHGGKGRERQVSLSVSPKVSIFSPGHTKSAWLGPPASAGYF